MRKVLFPLYLVLYFSLVALAFCSLLLLFLLLGEWHGPAETEPAPALASVPTGPEAEFAINTQGELCRRLVLIGGQPALEKPVSGRFTASGQLLVRQ